MSNEQPKPATNALTSAPGAVGTGAASGAAVGALAGPLGAAIGAGLGAVLGALGVMKGKTAHLDFNVASQIARVVADKINAPIIATLGYNTTAYSNYGLRLADEVLIKLKSNENSSTRSYQIWIGNAIKDMSDRASAKVGDSGGVIYVYALYIGMNYDASRPEEFGQILGNDLSKMFQNLVPKFPQTQEMVYGAKAVSSSVTPAKVESKSPLEKIIGGGGSSTPAANTGNTSTAGVNVTSADGQKVIIAGFIVLIIGFLIFTRKKK